MSHFWGPISFYFNISRKYKEARRPNQQTAHLTNCHSWIPTVTIQRCTFPKRNANQYRNIILNDDYINIPEICSQSL